MSQQQRFNARRFEDMYPDEARTLNLSDEKFKQARSTARLPETQRSRLPITWRRPTRPDEGMAENFIVLPHGTTSRMIPRWLIQLVGLTPTMRPLGIEVASDVVFGIVHTLESRPDLDLDLFGGFVKGVSRRHAMLRPSANHLYLIDLHSTNGTRINGAEIESGVPCVVANNDIISLGALTFTLRIVATPEDIERAMRR